MTLRDRCDIILLNVHVPTEDNCDHTKDRFYEELGRLFDQFPTFHMKILLADCNAKMRREDILKPLVWNES
jgi:hypothetical protein